MLKLRIAVMEFRMNCVDILNSIVTGWSGTLTGRWYVLSDRWRKLSGIPDPYKHPETLRDTDSEA